MTRQKYIMVFHANLHYSGLRPEKFEFVIRKSYEKIFDLFSSKYKNCKYCFEASGFTIDMMAVHTPDVLVKLKKSIDSGACEFIGSPYAHSIITNYHYDDAVKSCLFSMQTYKRHLGILPRTAWNPECCWNDDVPKIYREAGFDIMNLDWDGYLISTRPEIAAIEKNTDKTRKDGSHMPWYDVDPDTNTLHYPVSLGNGMKGVFRSDRISGKTLYYLMSTNNIPVDDSQKITVSLNDVVREIDHWSGKKKQGFLICYAEDAEYVGTTGYFFLKHYGKHQVFDENPDAIKLLSVYIDHLLERGELARVDESVDNLPLIENEPVLIEKDMAWHRTYATAWAMTPSALALDPYCRLLSEKLRKIKNAPRSFEEELLYQKAWFHLICAENSDGRWPPYPKKPGNFNVYYIWDQLVKAEQAMQNLGGYTDFKHIPSTEINPAVD
ncbi:MAG: hypothetical protein A2096_15850 [Spirochaetes bacterium GWF1_41_5]|nr:MAG: hypothetical protein A2096_15850 [Spirochaetes bacterium GWF1_41_5]HBE04130.1 hypothetical protein [Spirochaetia bacterium]